MAFYDLPRDELLKYKPERREEKDFDAFWASTLADAAQASPGPPLRALCLGPRGGRGPRRLLRGLWRPTRRGMAHPARRRAYGPRCPPSAADAFPAWSSSSATAAAAPSPGTTSSGRPRATPTS